MKRPRDASYEALLALDLDVTDIATMRADLLDAIRRANQDLLEDFGDYR